jgi:flavin-dependent dehydrogenase
VNEEVDILIVGGGPAGLLAASYLAERHNVALIERGLLGETTKYWLTTFRRLEKHALSECVSYKASSMVVGTFLGGHLETFGDLVVVNDQLLMSLLVKRCKRRGVLFAEHCSLLNLKWTDNRILVETTSKSYVTRLVVDASGARSPIATTFRLHKLYGFFSVYGALLQNISLRSDKVILAYVERLGDPPPIIEVFPSGKDAAYCSVFIYSKLLTPPQNLKTLFEEHCSKNGFFITSDDTVIVSPKMGAIPIGAIGKQHLAGIVPVGEAGLVQPPLLGSAFNEVLEYCEDVCAHIARVLMRTAGVPSRPSYAYPLLKRVQDRLQLNLICALLNGNVEAFDRFVRSMAKLPSETIYNLCFSELTWGQIATTAIRSPLRITRSD